MNKTYKFIRLSIEFTDLSKKVRDLNEQANSLPYKEVWHKYQEYKTQRSRLKIKINREYMDNMSVTEEEHNNREEDPIIENLLSIDECIVKFFSNIRLRLCDTTEVNFQPSESVWSRVKVSNTSTYNSQGYGASQYAKGALLPEKKALEEHGFETHIRVVSKSYGNIYELWGNAPEWMLFAACRSLTISKAANILSESSLHPQVIMPTAYNHPDVKNPKW